MSDERPLIPDRFDMFPNIERCLSMTLREWLYFHNVMHRHYTKYRGRAVLKPPFDWLVQADIVYDTQPQVIIEIGSFEGGNTLWLADYLDAIGSEATVIGVDISERPQAVAHPRIMWVHGDCLAPQTVSEVERLADGRRGLVIEDSDHKYDTTRRILDAYNSFVAPGNYLIVEDTIVEFLNLPPFPGPLKAVHEFVAAHPEFRIDRTREKYILTYNPMGYLLRVEDASA